MDTTPPGSRHRLARRLIKVMAAAHVRLYLRDGADLVAVASQAGRPQHPPSRR